MKKIHLTIYALHFGVQTTEAQSSETIVLLKLFLLLMTAVRKDIRPYLLLQIEPFSPLSLEAHILHNSCSLQRHTKVDAKIHMIGFNFFATPSRRYLE